MRGVSRRGVALISAALALGAPATALGQEKGFRVNRFEPAERGSDWFILDSLDLRAPTVRPAVGVIADYHTPGLTTFGSNQQEVVANQLTLHGGASLTILDRVRLGLHLPFVATSEGAGHTIAGRVYGAPSPTSAIGDLRMAADFRLFGRYGDPFLASAGSRVWAPTGNPAAYTGDDEWRVDLHAQFAGDIGPIAYAARAAYDVRSRDIVFAGSPLGGRTFAYAVAVGARFLDRKILVGPELYGSAQLDNPRQQFVGPEGSSQLDTLAEVTESPSRRGVPLEVLFGVHAFPVRHLKLHGGVGRGITPSYGSPDLRVLFGVDFHLAVDDDRDGDEIPDKEDACPTRPGPRTDDPKTNGCPPERPKPTPKPQDRDGDGIIDAEDACPDDPGEKNDDPKKNGCPSDRDNDGVIDREDACPDVPGVKSDDPKKNGCPGDKDGDGVLDNEDACPDVAGLKTTDPKTNGCPDPDRDKDGIPNDKDACPDEPGESDPDPSKNGCPKAYVQADEIKIRDQVRFQTGSAKLQAGKESESVLQAVLTVMTQHPEIKHVRIEGHTDSTGSAATNRKLSEGRAQTVMKWLASHGIDKGRMTAKGFGPDRPIGDNKTEDGKRLNRRVEFHIEK